MKHWNCNICDKPLKVRRDSKGNLLWQEGNNADPLAKGNCCDVCHQKVLEARGVSTEVSMMAYMPHVHLEKEQCPYLKGAKFTVDEHHDHRTLVGKFPTLCNAQKFLHYRLSLKVGSLTIIEKQPIKGKAKRKRYYWVVRYKPADYNTMWRFNADDVLTELDDMMQ
jgi:hypothetical protein